MPVGTEVIYFLFRVRQHFTHLSPIPSLGWFKLRMTGGSLDVVLQMEEETESVTIAT